MILEYNANTLVWEAGVLYSSMADRSPNILVKHVKITLAQVLGWLYCKLHDWTQLSQLAQHSNKWHMPTLLWKLGQEVSRHSRPYCSQWLTYHTKAEELYYHMITTDFYSFNKFWEIGDQFRVSVFSPLTLCICLLIVTGTRAIAFHSACATHSTKLVSFHTIQRYTFLDYLGLKV